MEQRTLGSAGLQVSAIGLGCMGMSYHRGPAPDPKAMIALIRKAVDHGVTFFDTAEVYGPFDNEELVGEALAPRPRRGRHRDQVRLLASIEDGPGAERRPEHIRRRGGRARSAASGPTSIHLLYQHRVDPEVPIEDVAGTVGELIPAGKVRHFGLSEAAVPTIRRAHAVPPVTALQSEYSLCSRDPEPAILPPCAELGIGFVPFSPLGRGSSPARWPPPMEFSEGEIRPHLPRFAADAREANLALVDRVRAVAEDRKGATPAQIALAWLLAQRPSIVPIPGTDAGAASTRTWARPSWS